jgi:hypothetical protein
MAFTLPTVIPLGSKSRARHPSIYAGFDELYNNNDSRDRGGDNYHDLWVSIKQMVWGKYNPYLSLIRRYSRFRFNIHSPHSWRSILIRSDNKSSQSSIIRNGNRKRNRHYFYYGIIISILTIGAPAYAEEGETNNTSNPVAAATGNVTNQAVQFQNNGAPSRQVIGPNISCNGATMTFSPFYMGNHTTPYDDAMEQQSYTVAENWGGQINFMVPLDGSLVERCKAAADRQIQKMELNYELVRIDNCAKLQQKGFMLMPGTRVYHICSDVIPIAKWKKAEAKVLACKTPPKPWWKPWHKPKETCNMSTLSDKREAAAKAAAEVVVKKAEKKTTTTTKK